jgi:chromosome segregation ATPase
MGILEQEGYGALKDKARRYMQDSVVRKINAHITKEMEKIMTELNRLSAAVDQELADDAAQNELIAELKRQLEEAQAAAAAAAAGEAGANERLAEALTAASDAAARLESNDAVEEPEPVDGELDPGTPELEHPQA